MARCPFAVWDEITGPVGDYLSGPFKIVHHTTEGNSYAGARAAFAANRSDPHFTVEGSNVFQHIDTAKAARALRNSPGGVQTNRDSAVQIEIVGFAARDKDSATLQTVARLCRWIETEHGVPQVWPNGFVRWSHSGADPGGHNRNAMNWDLKGGHYGHSQVPENTHWDPAYTPTENEIVTPQAVNHDALLEQVGVLTGWTAPAGVTAPPASDLYSLADRVVDGVRTSLTNSNVPVFPDGVHHIEVDVSDGHTHVHLKLSGRTPASAEFSPVARHATEIRRARKAKPSRRRKRSTKAQR
jgi:hypothetical protein